MLRGGVSPVQGGDCSGQLEYQYNIDETKVYDSLTACGSKSKTKELHWYISTNIQDSK